MANTRTRPAKKADTPAEDEFDPTAVAPVADVHTADEPLDEGDDGSEGPIEPVADVDPSAGNALGKTTAGMTEGQQAAQAELSDYMRRMSNLFEERAAVNDDIKELLKEIKGKGYDNQAFKLIMKIDSLSETQKQKRRDQNSINATYAHAVGIDEDLL